MKRAGFKQLTYKRKPITPIAGFRGAAHMDLGPTVSAPIPKESERKDSPRMAWGRRTFTACQHCRAPGTEPHHHNVRGKGIMGGTAEDSRVVWLCAGPKGCHRLWHDKRKLRGYKEANSLRRMESIIADNQAAYAAMESGVETYIVEDE